MRRLWVQEIHLLLKLKGIILENTGVLQAMDWIQLLMLVPILMFNVSNNNKINLFQFGCRKTKTKLISYQVD